jgi:hypothetical protein
MILFCYSLLFVVACWAGVIHFARAAGHLDGYTR